MTCHIYFTKYKVSMFYTLESALWCLGCSSETGRSPSRTMPWGLTLAPQEKRQRIKTNKQRKLQSTCITLIKLFGDFHIFHIFPA